MLHLELPVRRTVAIKTPKPGRKNAAAASDRLREAWVTGALEHSNVEPHGLASSASAKNGLDGPRPVRQVRRRAMARAIRGGRRRPHLSIQDSPRDRG
jgi:hypothetical protein